MPRGPRCETTRLTQAFVSVLEVRDLRYSLATYGSFLFDTPRRVGTSKALDASITALATTHHTLYSQQGSVKALPAWGRALAALREALRDPKQVTTTETLCAIYFIYICQVSSIFSSIQTNHGRINDIYSRLDLAEEVSQ